MWTWCEVIPADFEWAAPQLSFLRVCLYDTIQEFNIDWKAECGQLNLSDATRNKKKYKKAIRRNQKQKNTRKLWYRKDDRAMRAI